METTGLSSADCPDIVWIFRKPGAHSLDGVRTYPAAKPREVIMARGDVPAVGREPQVAPQGAAHCVTGLCVVEPEGGDVFIHFECQNVRRESHVCSFSEWQRAYVLWGQGISPAK